MFIIVGLGNPTAQYAGTRHNVGFDVIDKIADEYNISVEGRKNRAFVGTGMIAGRKVLLAKPQTFMNLSGGWRTSIRLTWRRSFWSFTMM